MHFPERCCDALKMRSARDPSATSGLHGKVGCDAVPRAQFLEGAGKNPGLRPEATQLGLGFREEEPTALAGPLKKGRALSGAGRLSVCGVVRT